jgi:broad specificity phosphatase PhoE
MKKIILARHGETEYNRLKKITGQLDIPLNSDGIEQAMMLSIELKDVYLEAIFSSPLKRCRQTVTEVKKFHRGVPLIFDDRLKESNAGVMEGKATSKMHEYSETFTPKGGESYFDLKKRIYDFIDCQIIQSSYDRILIVSHGGPIKVFRSYFENTALLSTEEMSIKNAKYWVITFSENQAKVLR